MGILRVEKTIKDSIIIHKYPILTDESLSFRAKGILTYLIGHADGWECQEEDLCKHSKDGRSSIQAGLKELREAGYVRKEPMRDENRIVGWKTIVTELPQEGTRWGKSKNDTNQEDRKARILKSKNVEKCHSCSSDEKPENDDEPGELARTPESKNLENRPLNNTNIRISNNTELDQSNTKEEISNEISTPPQCEQSELLIAADPQPTPESAPTKPQTPITLFQSRFHCTPEHGKDGGIDWYKSFMSQITDLAIWEETLLSWNGKPKNYRGLWNAYKRKQTTMFNQEHATSKQEITKSIQEKQTILETTPHATKIACALLGQKTEPAPGQETEFQSLSTWKLADFLAQHHTNLQNLFQMLIYARKQQPQMPPIAWLQSALTKNKQTLFHPLTGEFMQTNGTGTIDVPLLIESVKQLPVSDQKTLSQRQELLSLPSTVLNLSIEEKWITPDFLLAMNKIHNQKEMKDENDNSQPG